MIPFSAAYDWFLKRASPVFSSHTQALIHDLDQATSPRARLLLIYALEYYAETQALINEKGEILTYCAVFYYKNFLKDHFYFIDKLFNRALNEFENKSDDLNQALVYCMLYYLNLVKEDWVETYTNAHQALHHFLKCAEQLPSEENRKQGCIYLDRAKDIAFVLVSFPGFTCQLLNEFDASQLSLTSNKIIDEINEAWRQKDKLGISRQIDLLTKTARRSSNVEEVAQAYCFCAQVMNWLQDVPRAIELLKFAVAWFFPESHNQLFARWMLALYQMQQAQYYQEAVINFETVTSGIDALITACDRQNQLYRRLWYEAFAAGMSRVLADSVNFKGIKGLGSDPFTHPSSKSGTPRLPPGGLKP